MKTKELTTERIRELMEYHDGVLYWRQSPRSGWQGKAVGYKAKNGYLIAKVDDQTCKVHRLVWLWHGKSLPKMLDHINGIRYDNRIENLRECSDSENAYNKGQYKNNSTGARNVLWNKANKNFNVQLTHNKTKIHIGVFDDFDLAELVAQEARAKYFGTFARKGI